MPTFWDSSLRLDLWLSETIEDLGKRGAEDMPIKWNITGNAMKARSLMDQINNEYAGFIESGTEHLADIKALRAQVGEMQDDLLSAANIMGNSGNGSGASGVAQEPPADPPAISETHIGKLAQVATPSAPAVAPNPTFPPV